jgi:hypothetical protein
MRAIYHGAFAETGVWVRSARPLRQASSVNDNAAKPLTSLIDRERLATDELRIFSPVNADPRGPDSYLNVLSGTQVIDHSGRCSEAWPKK